VLKISCRPFDAEVRRYVIDIRDNVIWRKSAAERDLGVCQICHTRLLQGMLVATNSLMLLPVPINAQPKSSMPLKVSPNAGFRVAALRATYCATDGKGVLKSCCAAPQHMHSFNNQNLVLTKNDLAHIEVEHAHRACCVVY
jgi:hypothetical protein